MFIWITLCLIFEELPKCFTKCLHNYIFLSGMHVASNFNTCLLMLVIIHLFDYSHSSRYEAVPHCGFNLHLSDN